MTVKEFPRISRRHVLKCVGGAGASALLAGCPSGNTRNVSGYWRPLSRQPFAAPRVCMDRIVRVIVGLRAYRPAGFVVRRDVFDGKIVIHNYGHGGGGLSLSWGSSALAVREARGLSATSFNGDWIASVVESVP